MNCIYCGSNQHWGKDCSAGPLFKNMSYEHQEAGKLLRAIDDRSNPIVNAIMDNHHARSTGLDAKDRGVSAEAERLMDEDD